MCVSCCDQDDHDDGGDVCGGDDVFQNDDDDGDDDDDEVFAETKKYFVAVDLLKSWNNVFQNLEIDSSLHRQENHCCS